ncbi:M20 family metallo-hydrolase [Roseivirga sp. E12]|uniref:M20 family metallo-hydrolase n=1 Tax=Roseivirga sp. E12 TaxID=2819237 RepID=UPI001ABD0C14|nr:M20 family metallo-hydrolase [Roseivirga sp. E12]MBO3697797.1 M20 family metallo-hydrolase [Roseivirga sp. E12]
MNINGQRLLSNVARFAEIGKVGEIGVERIALSEEDKEARDLLKTLMLDLGLEVHIDQLGNMIGIRKGRKDLPAVAFGSHLDTVYAGGRYDGALGVIAGLELIQTLNDQGVETDHPLAIINFTNEEGVRFAPDMMGSHVYSGQAKLDDILVSKAYDNPNETVGSQLKAIGYDGALKPGSIALESFFELHIEQGPVLENEAIDIGVVEMVQGIHWTRYTIEGEANHAGTTPNQYRKDTGYASAEIIKFIGDYSRKEENPVLTTVGSIRYEPNTINIIPREVSFTVDLRSTDKEALNKGQIEIDTFINKAVNESDLAVKSEVMVRFEPVHFPKEMPDLVENTAAGLELRSKRMPSGAGHDAQMMNHCCPSTMIFVPSVNGISHNVEEYSKDQDVINGANVLLNAVLNRAKQVS